MSVDRETQDLLTKLVGRRIQAVDVLELNYEKDAPRVVGFVLDDGTCVTFRADAAYDEPYLNLDRSKI